MMSKVLYKRAVVDISIQLVVFSSGDDLALQARPTNVGTLHRDYLLNSLYFEDICETLKQEVMTKKSK